MSDDVFDRSRLHQVPVRVDQRVLPPHVRGEIGERVERLGVLRTVALRPPAPRRAAGFDPRRVRDARRRGQVVYEIGFEDPSRGVADDDHAPRECPWERRDGLSGPDAKSLFGIGKPDAVHAVAGVGCEMRATVSLVKGRLGQQHPLS